MLKALATRFLQHLTDQNNWSREYLTEFSGQVLQLDIAFVKTNLTILEDGSLAIAGETALPDASIHISPSLALRLLAKDEAAKMQIKIDGDTHLATEFGKVLQNMRWDIEEDLSHIVGDIAASKLGEVSLNTFSGIKKQSSNLAEMLSEYWQEEKSILAKKRHVERFNNEVDTLQSDLARFEKRLAKLSKQLESGKS